MPHPLADLKIGESREITWEVTQEHIDRGAPEDCWNCPQALALQELFPGFTPEVDVSLRLSQEIGGTLEMVYVAGMTDDIERFMDSFDLDETVLPGSFKATFTRLR